MFINAFKSMRSITVTSLKAIFNMTKKTSRFISVCHLYLITLLFISFFSSACSVVLDPSVCTSNADCNGGVCQLGVCIGDIKVPDADLIEAGEQAGMDMTDLGPDSEMAGETVDDMMMAGEIPGGEPLRPDMMVEEVFSCEINTISLMNTGVTRRNMAPEIDGSTHWITNEATVTVSFDISTPNDELWLSKTKVFLGDEEQVTSVEDDRLQTSLTLENEGNYRLRLVIGDTDDVRCVDQVFIMADRSAPQLSLLTPSSPETWIGLLSGDAQTTVSVEIRDLSQVELSVSNATGNPIATRELSDETLWSTAVSLSEGENRFTLVANDELQQTQESELIFHYDPYPPGIGLTAPASNRTTIEANRLNITGFIYQRMSLSGNGGEGGIESNARVIVTNYAGQDNSGAEIDRVQVRSDDSGAFSLNIQLALDANFIEVCAFDRAENESCTELYVTRVESQPCVNITSNPFTSQANYTLSGNVCPSVNSLSLSVNGGPSQNLVINQDLSFSREITLTADGALTPLNLIATATDEQTASADFDVLWDSTPPIVVISSPSPSGCYNQETLQVCGRVIDSESGTQSLALNRAPLDLSDQYVEGEAWWESFCTEVDLQIPRNQPFHEQTIHLSGVNQAGLSAETSVTITVDRIAPELSFDAPSFEQWYAPNALGRVELRGDIVYTGCSLASPNPIQLSLADGTAGTLVLEGNGRFSYRSVLEDGAHQLQGTIRDRAGNERELSYAFNVDGTGPNLDLITPNLRSVAQQANLSITVEGEDSGSGLLNTSAVLRGAFGDQAMSSLALGGTPERFELSTSLDLEAGEHPLSVVISDQVGNESVIEFTYIRDITAPEIFVVSPNLNLPLPTLDHVILEASDDLSAVMQVSVNNVPAQRFGDFWLAEDVVIDPIQATLNIDAIDEAGNLSALTQANPLAVDLAPLAWQDPGRLGLNARAYQKENGAYADDSGLGLGPIKLMQWFAGFATQAELLSFYTTAENFSPTPFHLMSENGVNSWIFDQVSHARYAQASFPVASQTQDIQSTTIDGVLTIFTLSQEDNSTPLLQVWQRFGELNEDTETIGEPLVSPEVWVEVRLGLPPILNAEVISLGDINGDGRLDLIAIEPNGVFLFRQNAEGEFDFDASGLNLRGLSALSSQTTKLWWVDLDGDDDLDLIAQNDQSVQAWLKSLSANTYNFELINNFPQISSGRQIDGWLTVDWGVDGTLDPIAWSSGQGTSTSLLRRYHNDNGQWASTAIVNEATLPQTLLDVQWFDFDADRSLELLLAAPEGLSSIDLGAEELQITIPSLPIVNEVDPEIQSIQLADFDADGDEDLLVNLNTSAPNQASDFDQLRGETWVLNASPELVQPELQALRIIPKRFNADAHDAQGVIIRIASAGDLNFDEVYMARPFHETILYAPNATTVTLQAIFPDYGTTGDHTVTEYNVAFGQQIVLVDPQE